MPEDYVSLVKPAEVLANAMAVPSFVEFLVLVGTRLDTGQNRQAYDVLLQTGLEPVRAWQIVDGWSFAKIYETETGWTPETVAAAIIMHDLPEAWREVDWVGLALEMQAV